MYNNYASDYDAACAALAVTTIILIASAVGLAGGISVLRKVSRYAELADFRRMKKKMSDIEAQFGYMR